MLILRTKRDKLDVKKINKNEEVKKKGKEFLFTI